MKIFLEQRVEAEARTCATLRANGIGCRAEALPKVLILFQGAHRLQTMSILEKPEDSSKVLTVFQGAHPN
jgi:hypothetical protein